MEAVAYEQPDSMYPLTTLSCDTACKSTRALLESVCDMISQ